MFFGEALRSEVGIPGAGAGADYANENYVLGFQLLSRFNYSLGGIDVCAGVTGIFVFDQDSRQMHDAIGPL